MALRCTMIQPNGKYSYIRLNRWTFERLDKQFISHRINKSAIQCENCRTSNVRWNWFSCAWMISFWHISEATAWNHQFFTQLNFYILLSMHWICNALTNGYCSILTHTNTNTNTQSNQFKIGCHFNCSSTFYASIVLFHLINDVFLNQLHLLRLKNMFQYFENIFKCLINNI